MPAFCDLERLAFVCDTYHPTTEMRRDVEVRVLVVKLRLEPVTAAIATAIHPQLRRILFAHGDKPRGLIRELLWAPAVPLQQLTVAPAPDANDTLVLDQVRIERVRARLVSKGNYWRLIVVLTVGPCDRDQLAALQEWVGIARSVSFSEAQPTLFQEHDDEPDDDDNDEDEPDEGPDVEGGEFSPIGDPPARETPRQVRRGRRPH